ncbi:MAG: two-component system response regulator PilR (NtrC family), partial [Gammaproteobacteria bacterium]
MSKKRILIIDDEPDILELLDITISRMGIETECAENVKDALQFLKEQNFDLCLTDMNLPDGDGLQIISHIQQHCPSVPVAMITAYGNTDIAIAALKAGAFDFVNKPIEIDRLRTLIDTALKLAHATTQVEYSGQVQLLGKTTVIAELRKKVTKLSRSQAPVYISGES